jgi:hypothetical protein
MTFFVNVNRFRRIIISAFLLLLYINVIARLCEAILLIRIQLLGKIVSQSLAMMSHSE